MHPQRDVNGMQPLPVPAEDDLQRPGGAQKEFVAHVQRMIGLSPTDGRELVHDLNLPKCRSSGVGAPQPSTGMRHHSIQIDLGSEQIESSETDPVEEVRELVRSAMRGARPDKSED